MRKREKAEKILGIYTDDVTDFFEKINKHDELINNNIKCSICKTIINNANFGSVLKKNDEYIFTCDLKQCIKELTKIKDGIK